MAKTSDNAADALERDISTLERVLDGTRAAIEREDYGWGDQRPRMQERLDDGTHGTPGENARSPVRVARVG